MYDIKFENFDTDHCLRHGVLADTMDSVQNVSHIFDHMQSVVS